MSGIVETINAGEVGQGDISDAALKKFAVAKQKSIDIFQRIENYLSESIKVLKETTKEDNKDFKTVREFKKMVRGIKKKIRRKFMKVVFFGRTSNGKSTVINAMLRNKILPSGIGHTTHCFLQVMGTKESEGYLLADYSKNRKSISSINQLASALSDLKLPGNAKIRICWPKDKFPMLEGDVVFIDRNMHWPPRRLFDGHPNGLLNCPGIDITPDLDSWIDNVCLDADVFVLVGNAESTITQTEKNFFHNVSSRLSKPNIFILQNRWDMSVNEEDQKEVQEQHYSRSSQFLTDELQVADKEEAKNRIFFVSAKEALIIRMQIDDKIPNTNGLLKDNYKERYHAFQQFEKDLKICLSESAIRTKFQTHFERGTNITCDLREIMLRKHDDFSKYCKSQVKKRDETLDSFHQKNEMLDLFISEIENTATQIVEMVARNVSDALNEEIQKLAVIVNDFDRPFRPDNELINVYKQDLHNHVGKKFESNLFQRFDEFQEDVKATQKRMKDRLALLLEDESLHTDIGLHGRMFKQFFKWNYDEVCVEFQEDINFRFSLMRYLSNGLQGIMRIVKCAAIFMQRPHSATCIELKDEPMHIFFVIVFTVVQRTRAKNAALLAALVYAGMYLREWWTWTDKTKESRLKSQYKEYACNKVKSIVNQIIFKCSNEVKRDLSSTGDELREAILCWKHGMEDDIRTCSKEIQRLEDKAEQFKFLGNKTHELEKELNSFIDEFLKKND